MFSPLIEKVSLHSCLISLMPTRTQISLNARPNLFSEQRLPLDYDVVRIIITQGTIRRFTG